MTLTPVVITIDTEPDNAWENHLNPSVANVRALRRLQDLLTPFGAKATCLITTRVAEDDECVALLGDLVRNHGAEVGAHLHPWETPPFLDSRLDARYASFPHDLPVELFERKMSALTESIEARFDRPRSYRAGRWGFVAEHVAVLEKLGYEVDTSVTPWNDWGDTWGIPADQGGRGGVDYRRCPRHPYQLGYDTVTRPGDADLLEIPLTVAFTRRWPALVRRGYGRYPTLARLLLRKTELVRPVWAVPSEEPTARLERMVPAAMAERDHVFNIAFHSSELVVGGSPATATQCDVDVVFGRIAMMLKMLATGNVEFMTLTATARRLLATRAVACPDAP